MNIQTPGTDPKTKHRADSPAASDAEDGIQESKTDRHRLAREETLAGLVAHGLLAPGQALTKDAGRVIGWLESLPPMSVFEKLYAFRVAEVMWYIPTLGRHPIGSELEQFTREIEIKKLCAALRGAIVFGQIADDIRASSWADTLDDLQPLLQSARGVEEQFAKVDGFDPVAFLDYNRVLDGIMDCVNAEYSRRYFALGAAAHVAASGLLLHVANQLEYFRPWAEELFYQAAVAEDLQAEKRAHMTKMVEESMDRQLH